MFAILYALGTLLVDLFKSRSRLEAENLFLRQQLTIALRRAPPRRRLRDSDRALLTWMTRLWPDLLGMAQAIQPETILRWHRAGFKASRIHGELLMLGFEVAQSTVSKYMMRGQNPPSQTWKTFLRNHAQAIAAIDMCVVPTVSFDLLFAFLVLGHGRRQLLWFEVTRHPTAEWLARQITEAFPGRSTPAYLVRDDDRAYGHVFTRRLRAMGIRDRPIAPQSPWQNGYAERLRRICGEFFALCGVLQSSAHALGIIERCALASSRPTIWRHCRRSDLGWATSPIRPDMIFGKDRHNRS